VDTIVRPDNQMLDQFFLRILDVSRSAVINDRIVVYRTLDTPANDHEMEVRLLIHEPNTETQWPEQFVGQLDDEVMRWIRGLQGENCNILWHVSEINPAVGNPTMLHSGITIATQEGGTFVLLPSDFFGSMVKLIFSLVPPISEA